jgi:hypothetical protein
VLDVDDGQSRHPSRMEKRSNIPKQHIGIVNRRDLKAVEGAGL